MKFERIGSRFRLQTDTGERKPYVVARIEAELDFVAQPGTRKSADRLRRRDAEEHRASVDEAGGLADDGPIANRRIGGSCRRYRCAQRQQHEHWESSEIGKAFTHVCSRLAFQKRKIHTAAMILLLFIGMLAADEIWDRVPDGTPIEIRPKRAEYDMTNIVMFATIVV